MKTTRDLIPCVGAPGPGETWEELLNCYLDGELIEHRQAELFGHLASCPACRARMDAVMMFRRVAREEYIALPPSADERFLERLADLKARTERVDREGDREPLWQSRRSVSLGTTVLMAMCLFVLGLYLPKLTGPNPRQAVGEQELVDLEAPVYGIMNTVYVITPGVTVESPRLISVDAP